MYEACCTGTCNAIPGRLFADIYPASPHARTGHCSPGHIDTPDGNSAYNCTSDGSASNGDSDRYTSPGCDDLPKSGCLHMG